MMKYAPLVRRQTMPVSQANSIETAIATGSAINPSPMPWAERMPTA